ncbi:type I asparaginase [Balneatrix alpica]|uniref:asparaginase n=1 Tax=Balneatrix alpica TaxID=75684 RepID=A0ABV5ZFU0_9GAMM|nr:type I asparaginase [Balneatrix alpica]
MSKRLYLAYTGGTLGMRPSAQGYVPAPGFLSELMGQLAPLLPTDWQLTLAEYPRLIDSSNATPADWLYLAQDIAANYEQHDGFVILHGTDTMAYSAAALSFWLQGLDKPVIITGSQIPACEARSDANNNVLAALHWAAQDDLCEVAIAFADRLIRGNRSTKVKATALDAFDSPSYPWLGQVGIHLQLQPQWLLPKPSQAPIWHLPKQVESNVQCLRLFPGISADLVEAVLALPYQGLVLQSFGVGNAPDQDARLLEVLEQATKAGKTILNVSQCLQAEVDPAYATGSRLAQAGVIAGGSMTIEAAMTKLHVLLAQGLQGDALRTQLERNLAGER